MNLNYYSSFCVSVSIIYLMVIFFLGNFLVSFNQNYLLWLTASLTAANMLILTSLFCKGRLTYRTILLNLIQLLLFCQLQMQLPTLLPQDSSPTLLKKQYELVAFRVINGFDLVDIMAKNDLADKKYGVQNAAAGITAFSMCFMACIFCLGIIFRGIRYLSTIERIKLIRKWLDPGMMIFSLMLISISVWINRDMSHWHVWIFDGILRVLDFGDAFQIFEWGSQSAPGSRVAGILFRIGISLGFIWAGYRHFYLPALEDAVMDRIEELRAIITSSYYLPRERLEAIRELQSYGKIAESAIPELVRLLENHHEELRKAAAVALKAVNSRWAGTEIAQEALPKLLDKLKRADRLTRIAAAEAIGEFGSYAKKVVPALMDVSVDQNQDKAVRDAVFQSLAKIGRAAVPELVRITDSRRENGEVRKKAAQVLARIGNEHPDVVVHHAVRFLKSNDAYTRDLAGDILKDLGPDAVSSLLGMLRRRILPELVIAAFKKIKPVAIIPRLLEMLRSDKSLREPIIHVLKAMMPVSSEKSDESDDHLSLIRAVGNFINDLRHEDSVCRATAATALGDIGFSARKAIPGLAKALCDNNGEVRVAAKEALEKIVLPPFSIFALVKKLGECEERCKAARELGEIGPGAEKAIPCLVILLGDDDQELRYEAARALKRIDARWRRHQCLDDLIPRFIKAMGGAYVEFPL